MTLASRARFHAIRFWWSTWSTLISGVAVAFALGFSIYSVMRPVGPPVTYELTAYDATPLVAYGDEVPITFVSTRTRACPATVRAWYVTLPDNQPVYTFPPATGGFTNIGRSTFTIHKPTSVLPGPGAYAYRAMVTSSCENGQTFITLAPDFSFVVGPKK